MIELGRVLREARERQGLDLEAAERATRIRRRHLAAIENERFDLLPGDAYARAFLREYAEFLGLEARALLDEYDLRFREEEPVPPPPVAPRRPRPRLGAVALLGLAAVAAVAAVIAWRPGGGERARTTAVLTPPPPAVERSRPIPPPPPERIRRPLPLRLELVASRGDCWLLVRRGSRSGPVLFQGILRRGERRSFRGPLWIRMGAPWNLDARLGGRPVALPVREVGDVLLGEGGLRLAP